MRDLVCALILAMSFGLGAGCGKEPPTGEHRTAEDASAASPGSSEAGVVADADAPVVVFLGDSLTAGYGLDEERAFPAIVDDRLHREWLAARVINAGVSGDTTAGGLSRLDWLLRQRPDVLFLCLGGNDGLRGIDLESTEENLRRIIVQAQEAGVRVVLAGMLLPPNYGPEYTERFAAIYPRLAEELNVDFVPFLLEGVAGVVELNLADGIHPNAEGHRRIAELVLPHVRAVLAELAAIPAS